MLIHRDKDCSDQGSKMTATDKAEKLFDTAKLCSGDLLEAYGHSELVFESPAEFIRVQIE